MNHIVHYKSLKRPSSRRKRKQEILFLLQGALLSFICVCITGLAFYLGGFNPFVFPSNLTATAISQRNASCQALINQAIQSSGNYCGETDSNNVCYGNTTIKAELAPDTSQRFSERGDIIAVDELRQLSAAPLDLDNNEWGIAVFKVIANLPRSLPGETVTMIVFGNTTVDNESGSLESFYFFSELGQIVCEAVPFDGLMITSPDGSGIRINVNGAELTLMGNASLKAVKNGEMEVSLFSGSGRIVSNGQEQYFGGGRKVRVGLGGENGVQSISGPSAPELLSQEELNTACTMTGQYCSQGEITPVTEGEAQQQLQGQITSTPTSISTHTPTSTPSPSITPTGTIFVLPSWTPSRTITPPPTLITIPIRTSTPTRTRIPTWTPSRTPTRTPTPTPSSTATATSTPTFTPTNTPTPTQPPIGPTEPICASVSVSALTNAIPNELGIDIINNSGGPITIERFFAHWVKSPTSQKLDRLLLNSILLWNTSDNDSPSDIPTEGAWISGADRTIPDATVRNFAIRFLNDLQPGDYEVHIVFDIGCQVTQSITIP